MDLNRDLLGVGDYCTQCGYRLRPLFNSLGCVSGCKQKPFPRFKQWWSAYVSVPRPLGNDDGRIGPDQLIQMSDCVVLFDFEGKVWQGNAKVKDVLVVVNKTWDATVGKIFPALESEQIALLKHYQVAPEALEKSFGRPYMMCLVRT